MHNVVLNEGVEQSGTPNEMSNREYSTMLQRILHAASDRSAKTAAEALMESTRPLWVVRSARWGRKVRDFDVGRAGDLIRGSSVGTTIRRRPRAGRSFLQHFCYFYTRRVSRRRFFSRSQERRDVSEEPSRRGGRRFEEGLVTSLGFGGFARRDAIPRFLNNGIGSI